MTLLERIEKFSVFIPLATLLILVLAVGSQSPVFLTLQAQLTLITDTATLFILAAGITFVVMLGSIDLSAQSVASLASIVVASTVSSYGYLAIGLAIAVGMIFGLLNGLIHVYLKLPSFIATLAMGSVATSAALLLSGMRSVPIPPELRQTVFYWIVGNAFGIPNQIIVGLCVLILGLLIERYSLFGRWSRAVGSGEPAALAAGVPVNRVKILALILSGGAAGLAGVVIGARLSSGSPTIANEFLLPAIAAIVVGGTAITGGTGTVVYTLIGVLIISVVRVGMTFMSVDIFAQQIVFGLLIIMAAAATIDRKKLPIVK
jgi:ribose transport system permease protein